MCSKEKVLILLRTNINIQYHKRYTQFNDIVKNKLVHTKELCHACTHNEITIRDVASDWLSDLFS